MCVCVCVCVCACVRVCVCVCVCVERRSMVVVKKEKTAQEVVVKKEKTAQEAARQQMRGTQGEFGADRQEDNSSSGDGISGWSESVPQSSLCVSFCLFLPAPHP